MPVMFGAFETSLRGGDSPSIDRKNKLHKGCSGHLHGHGVKKEKSVRDVVSASRSCSLTYSVDEPIYGVNFGNSSSEEDRNWGTPRNSISPMIPHLKISPTNSSSFNPHSRGSITPDLLLGSSEWNSLIVGRISRHLNLESTDAKVRKDSENTLQTELNYATHLGM